MGDEWVKVASVSDLKPGKIIQVELNEEPVALAQTEDGEIMAVSDVCSHEFVLLHDGWIEGNEIECPEHGSMFDLKTGEVRNLPATQPIPIYEVKIEDDDIYLQGPKEVVQT